MTKRLVFCFDGTWNRLSADNPTNVVKLAQMVRPIDGDGIPQLVYYDEGIGTNTWAIIRLLQGMVGWGMVGILREAYRFLIFNYEPGDEIYIFGFSRGAFTARSFAGFIRHAGILDVASASQIDKALEIYRTVPAGKTGEESGQAMRFRLRHCRNVCVSEVDREFRQRVEPDGGHDRVPLLDIRYLGVWDTVRALGVPDVLPFSADFNRKYGFHDAVLTSKVRAARHAVALDERRPTFPPTLFGCDKISELNERVEAGRERPFDEWRAPYQERWFPGVHGAIGGGGIYQGLSDAALHWVLSGARRAGLRLRDEDDSVAFAIRPDPFDAVMNDPPGLFKRVQYWLFEKLGIARKGPERESAIAHATYRRWHRPDAAAPYRPRSLRRAKALLERWPYAPPPEWKGDEGGKPSPLEDFATTGRETLSSIAADRLGDGARWPELFELNRDRLEDPDYLPTDIVLRVPARPDAAPSPPA